MKKTTTFVIFMVLMSGFVFAEPLVKQSEVRGMEQARVQYKDQVQEQRIERTMSRIQTTEKEMLQKLNQLKFSEDSQGTIIAEGKTEAKLLGLIKMNKKVRYQVDEYGHIYRLTNMFERFWDYEDNDFEVIA